MARDFSPRGRLERREQQDLALFSGITARESKIRHQSPPGGIKGSRNAKSSEYNKQLRAKQLAKRLYGVLEKPFKNCFKKASRMKGSTGTNLLSLLERRLDNVVFRLSFARTRKEARQLVVHGAILVNNNSITIPSYLVDANDEVSICKAAHHQGRVQEAMALAENRVIPDWLVLEPKDKKGLVKRQPRRDDMFQEINEQLIVELYSK